MNISAVTARPLITRVRPTPILNRRAERVGDVMSGERNGGRGGIRTHGRVAPTSDFESGALNHSATLPCCARVAVAVSLEAPGRAGKGKCWKTVEVRKCGTAEVRDT